MRPLKEEGPRGTSGHRPTGKAKCSTPGKAMPLTRGKGGKKSKEEQMYIHRRQPEGVVCRGFCLDSGTFAVSETTFREVAVCRILLPKRYTRETDKASALQAAPALCCA